MHLFTKNFLAVQSDNFHSFSVITTTAEMSIPHVRGKGVMYCVDGRQYLEFGHVQFSRHFNCLFRA